MRTKLPSMGGHLGLTFHWLVSISDMEIEFTGVTGCVQHFCFEGRGIYAGSETDIMTNKLAKRRPDRQIRDFKIARR